MDVILKAEPLYHLFALVESHKVVQYAKRTAQQQI